MKFLLTALLSLTWSACTAKNGSSVQWTEKVVHPGDKSLKIPRSVQESIDQEFVRKFRATEKAQILSDDQILAKRTKAYLEIQIFLEGQAKETLGGNIRFESTRGGGKLNLRDLVQTKRGSFYLRFDVRDPESKSEVEYYDLYFWSTARPSKIKDEIYGLDCGTILKLDPASFQGKGFRLNATDDRYAPVVEGIYYFAHHQGPRMAVAALQVGDVDELQSCLR